jgi:hypothetical protein
MSFLLRTAILFYFFALPCFLYSQKTFHYFSFSELLDLSLDDPKQVQANILAKGYELYPSSDPARLSFQEPSNRLRTGSSLTKFKDPQQKVFRIMEYIVALQSPESAQWLRTLNTSIQQAGYKQAFANDTASFHLSRDSLVQILIKVYRNSERLQMVGVTIFEPFQKVRSLSQFSTSEMETLFTGMSASQRTAFLTSKAFLKHILSVDTYYQTTPANEMFRVGWKDAYAEGDDEWLRLQFTTEQTYQQYLSRFRASGYQATPGSSALQKGDFQLQPNSTMLTLKLIKLAPTKSDTPAQFPGGKAAWSQFIERNVDLTIPVKKGAPKGTYVVEVEFGLTKTGEIDMIFRRTKHGYGMEEELIRVVKASPRWIPEVKNGRNSEAYLRQSVTFTVEED